MQAERRLRARLLAWPAERFDRGRRRERAGTRSSRCEGKFADYERAHARHKQLGFEGFAEAVTAAADAYRNTGDLDQAAQKVWHLSEARRVFITDEHGQQTRGIRHGRVGAAARTAARAAHEQRAQQLVAARSTLEARARRPRTRRDDGSALLARRRRRSATPPRSRSSVTARRTCCASTSCLRGLLDLPPLLQDRAPADGLA